MKTARGTFVCIPGCIQQVCESMGHPSVVFIATKTMMVPLNHLANGQEIPLRVNFYRCAVCFMTIASPGAAHGGFN